MQTLKQLEKCYESLLQLQADLDKAEARKPTLPMEKLCVSLDYLSYRVTLATLSSDLAALVFLREKLVERFVARAAVKRIGFANLWTALLRHRSEAS